MSTHIRGRDLQISNARLSLVAAPSEAPLAAGHDSDSSAADTTRADLPYVAPEMFGLRVSQSPEEALQAAEFLVATRLQEESRGRIARVRARLRAEHDQDPEHS